MDYFESRKHIIAAVIKGDIDVSYATLDEIQMIKEEAESLVFNKVHTKLFEERKVMVFAEDNKKLH